MIKTQKMVEEELVQNVIAQTDKITYFGRGGIVRGILRSLSGLLAELYNDVVQTKRSIFVELSQADDLDAIGVRHGVARRGASNSSVVLTFTGTINTLVPKGTQVKSTLNNMVYKTKQDLVIGSKNTELYGQVDVSVSDNIVAESTLTGIISRTPIDTVKSLITPIAGVDSVTNNAPSFGGDDEENDSIYSQRLINQITLLNQGTSVFYESLAIASRNDVVRAIAVRHGYRRETIYVVKDSGGPFIQSEIDEIEANIIASQRALHPVNVLNLTFTDISIEAGIVLETGADLTLTHRRIADKIANYIDWRVWDNVNPVLDDKIIDIIVNDEGVYDLDIDTFSMNGGLSKVTIPETSLPRFIYLKLTDLTSSTVKDSTLKQSYIST